MKQTFSVCISGLCLMVLLPLSAAAKGNVVFDTYEWDFGTLSALRGAVCHNFTLTNHTDHAGDIPSCECVQALYPTEPIAPDQTAQVMVVMDPANALGNTYRHVEILDTEGKTLGALSVKAVVNDTPSQGKYPFQDPTLSNEERVENLLSLLTPEEKVGLMMNKSVSVDRLGIPSYNWWSEACHGVRQGGYTVYPQPIGMAAAFDAQMVYDVFSTVSDEARANWNRSDTTSLACLWAPSTTPATPNSPSGAPM